MAETTARRRNVLLLGILLSVLLPRRDHRPEDGDDRMKSKSFMTRFMDDAYDLDKGVVTGLLIGSSMMLGASIDFLASFTVRCNQGREMWSWWTFIVLIVCAICSAFALVFTVKIILARMELKERENDQQD